MLLEILNTIDSAVWGPWLLILLLGVGVLFTIRLGLIQITSLPRALKLIFFARNRGDGDIDSFKALCTALAATVGTGNIVGVATAIKAGGPGALLWMWIAAFFGMAMVVMGVSAEDMSIAANYVIEQGGGQIVVADGEIVEFLPLPVGGIVSDAEPEEIKAQEEKIDQAARSLGSDLPNPMMYMFFLPITAIPDYAITDVGPVDYVNLTTFEPVLAVREK